MFNYYDVDEVQKINGITIGEDDVMTVYSGGTATNVTVKKYSYLFVRSGGTATNIKWTPSIGHVRVESGARVTYASAYTGVYYGNGEKLHTHSQSLSSKKVDEDQIMVVMSGGTAINTTVKMYGELSIHSGGTAINTSATKGADIYIYSGGKITGQTRIDSGGVISIEPGVIVDFDLRKTSAGAAALMNCPLYYFDEAVFTLTVDGKQTNGTYKLAGGASEFSETISVVNASGKQLGTLTVGSSVTVSGKTYKLNLSGSSLTVAVSGKSNIDTTAPTVSNVKADITAATNKNVTVTATFSDNVAVSKKLYRIGNGSWKSYSNGVTITQNDTVSFKAVDSSGNESKVVSYKVTNIDKTAPAKPTSVKASITKATNQAVTVTASFSKDSTKKQYSLDNKSWSNYSNGVKVTKNGTVYFRGTDTAGNISPVVSYKVTNIDTTPPTKPTAKANTTKATNQAVTVTATFSKDSEKKQYSLDNKKWSNYSNGVKLTKNGTVYFRGIDAAGNISTVTTYKVSNIDTTPPTKPTAKANTTKATNQAVTVTATFSKDSDKKQYSLDNKKWSTYSNGVKLTKNGTVYFRGLDAAGNISPVVSYKVTNIDTTAPAKPTAKANTTKTTNQAVTVTATFSKDSDKKQYSLDNKKWSDYSNGVKLTKNGTVYFRGIDAAGNISPVVSYKVSNITQPPDTTPPAKPTAEADITTTTKQTVTVTATFSKDSEKKQYSLDGKKWSTYSSGIKFTKNGTVYFRGIDAAGNISDVTTYRVSNITSNTIRSGLVLQDQSETVTQAYVYDNTTLNDWGKLYVESGGTANRTTLNGGALYVSFGGVANSTALSGSKKCCGSVTIHSGGTANSTTAIDCGWVYVESGGVANNTTVNYDGWLYVFTGGTANSITVNYGGDFYVYSGGVANSTTVNTWGSMYVHSGGTATNIVWTPCEGRVYVSDGGYATFVSKYSGVYYGSGSKLLSNTVVMDGKTVDSACEIYVMNGGVANSTTVNYWDGMYVSSGGVANSTTVSNIGILNVYSGGVANNTTLFGDGDIDCLYVYSAGSLVVYSGGIANSTTVNAWGDLRVSSGGVANSTTVNYVGSMCVSSGGTANSTTVKSGGYLHVSSAGTATNIVWTPCEGHVYVSDGGYATFVSKYSGVYCGSGNKLLSNTIVIDDKTVDSACEIYVMNGGVANRTMVTGGDDPYYGSFGGYLYIFSGGVANSTTVKSNGSMCVSSGGVANNTTVFGGCDEWSLCFLGNLDVSSGGVANSTTVNSGGNLHVDSGGTATNIVWTPCEGHVYVADGGYATFVSRYSGVYYGSANKLLSNTAVMNGKTLDPAYEINVMNGGVANNTTVNNGGLYVSSGGTANNTTVNDFGYIYVSSGGTINSTTLNSGYFDVSSGGTANNTTVNNGRLIVSGTANNTTVNGGELYVYGGKLTGQTTIANGAYVLFVSSTPILDFDISTLAPGAVARINNLSRLRIWSGAIFTLTVSGSQANGIYKLAEGASGFNNTISVVNPSGSQLGTLTVGQKTTINGISYSLNLNSSGTLSVSVSSVVYNNAIRTDATAYSVGNESIASVKDESALMFSPSEQPASSTSIGAEWEMLATADFNADGKADTLWRNSFVGDDGSWYSAYCTKLASEENDWRMVDVANAEEWNFLGSGDFDGDGASDIAIIGNDGVVGIWGVQDGGMSSWSILSAVTPEWSFSGIADFNADGTDDIAWSNPETGLAGFWQIENKELASWHTASGVAAVRG